MSGYLSWLEYIVDIDVVGSSNPPPDTNIDFSLFGSLAATIAGLLFYLIGKSSKKDVKKEEVKNKPIKSGRRKAEGGLNIKTIFWFTIKIIIFS